jgi:hypothetical protein
MVKPLHSVVKNRTKKAKAKKQKLIEIEEKKSTIDINKINNIVVFVNKTEKLHLYAISLADVFGSCHMDF